MFRDVIDGKYVGKSFRDLSYSGKRLSVSDSQVRRDVVLYDGEHGFDQEGCGFRGFELRMRQRGFSDDEAINYSRHISEIVMDMARHKPTLLFCRAIDFVS